MRQQITNRSVFLAAVPASVGGALAQDVEYLERPANKQLYRRETVPGAFETAEVTVRVRASVQDGVSRVVINAAGKFDFEIPVQ